MVSDHLTAEPARRFMVELVSGGSDHWPRLWTLLNLELWWRCWVDQEPINEVVNS